jgi:hypothetical protein
MNAGGRGFGCVGLWAGVMLTGAVFFAGPVFAQKTDAKAQKKPPRAAPPKWDKQVTDVIFFKDVFKEALAGERPADLGRPPAVAAGPANGGGNSGAASGGDAGTAAASGAGWSKVVAGTTLEDQIKAIKQSLDKEITTPSEFAGKGYSIARREFSALAVLFAVIAEYDGDVRWKSSAAVARDRFSALAGTAKVGSQQAYNAAKDGRSQLEDLLGGGSFPKGEAEAGAEWSKVADRAPIMQNLGLAFDEKVAKWTGSEATFKSNADAALAEAQMISIYAALLGKEGMEDADGDSYKEFLKKLREGAAEVAEAAKSGDADKARKAAGEIKKSCDGCHGEYR